MLLLALLAGPAAAAATPSAFERYADDFERQARAERAVGGTIAFVQDGAVTGRRYFGAADEERRQPVDENTIYHWASITKTFTAIGLMQLVERGLVRLDDPVVSYLPEFGAAHNPYGPISEVTIRHLLNHSSGLRDPTWPWNADGAAERAEWQPHSPTSWSQLVAVMPYTGLQFRPGSRYSYSNLGSILIAEIIERLTGDDIEAYLDKNLLRPLGMSRTYFDMTPWHLQAYRSNSYRWRGDQRDVFGREFDTGITTGNGGLNAPVGDMVRYLNFLIGVGDTALYERILPRARLRSMWQPLFPAGYDPTVDERMAQHFFTIDAAGADRRVRHYIGHTGSQDGYRSFFYILPEARAGIIAVVNTTVAPNPRPFVFATRRAAFEHLFPAIDAGR